MKMNAIDVSRSHAEIIKEVSGMKKLVDGGKYKKAIDKGWKFAKNWRRIEISPATTSFWKYMGLAYINTKDFDGASKCFENALITGPKDVEAIMGRSMARMAMRDFKTADVGFATAAKLSPKDPTPLIMGSICMGSKGDKKKSVELARKAAKVNSKIAAALCLDLIGSYLKNEKYR